MAVFVDAEVDAEAEGLPVSGDRRRHLSILSTRILASSSRQHHRQTASTSGHIHQYNVSCRFLSATRPFDCLTASNSSKRHSLIFDGTSFLIATRLSWISFCELWDIDIFEPYGNQHNAVYCFQFFQNSHCRIPERSVLLIITRGFYHHAATIDDPTKDQYRTLDNFPAGIDPDSSLVGMGWKWVVYHNVGFTVSGYMDRCTAVELEWLLVSLIH
jgi:hypothetical protein